METSLIASAHFQDGNDEGFIGCGARLTQTEREVATDCALPVRRLGRIDRGQRSVESVEKVLQSIELRLFVAQFSFDL